MKWQLLAILICLLCLECANCKRHNHHIKTELSKEGIKKHEELILSDEPEEPHLSLNNLPSISNISTPLNETSEPKNEIVIKPKVANASEPLNKSKSDQKVFVKNSTANVSSPFVGADPNKKILFKETPDPLDSLIYEEHPGHIGPSNEDIPPSIYNDMILGKPRKKYYSTDRKKEYTTIQMISKYSEKYYDGFMGYATKFVDKVKDRKEIIILSLFCLSIVALKIFFWLLWSLISALKRLCKSKKEESEPMDYQRLKDIEKEPIHNKPAKKEKRSSAAKKKFDEDNFGAIFSPKSAPSFEKTSIQPHHEEQKPLENTLTLDIERFIEEIEKSEMDTETKFQVMERKEAILESLKVPQNPHDKATSMLKRKIAEETVLSRVLSQNKK